jgi:predicted branched-subunit amino acid permease
MGAYFKRRIVISLAALQGVVSGEFATGNGLVPLTAPMISSLIPAGANLT